MNWSMPNTWWPAPGKGGEGEKGDERDPTTPAGKEELRAIGLGKYAYSETGEPSENSIREENGLALRRKY